MASDGDPLPRPSLKALDFFNSVRGHPRFNPRCERERAMYTPGLPACRAPALVAHTYWPIPPARERDFPFNHP